MNTPLICDIHGQDYATIVCAHILDSLRDGLPRGFSWSIDEDGEYSAVCGACQSMSDADWEVVAVELGKVLCLSCYKRAAALNGISAVELEGGRA